MNEDIPRDEGYDTALDGAIGEALEGEPRAAEWFQLMRALEKRRELLQKELEITDEPDLRKKLEAEITQADEHIAVLHEEAELTSFVEDTVRFAAEVRRLQSG